MRSRLLKPPAAGTVYASSDDDEDAAADGSLPAQWWKEIVTLNIWLGPFRIPRAVTALCGVFTGYRGGAVGLAVFAFVVVLYALFSASSGAYAPEARQRAFAKELRREARENRCEPCAP
jgi:hypothetical protein